MARHILTWEQVNERVAQLAERLRTLGAHRIYGVPRGGSIIAGLLQQHGFTAVLRPDNAHAIVDDIVDSGHTRKKFLQRAAVFDAIVDKTGVDIDLGWVVFPWEGSGESDMKEGIARILQYLGLDVTHESIRDTPARVVKSWAELYGGYQQDPKDILSRTFPPEGYDEMVGLRDIDFVSMCEHHMLPFFGKAHVGYIPNGRVVGISKLARLVECYARRLQIQERLTHQVVQALQDALEPIGVGVIIEAHHSCMGSRGIKKPNTRMTTSDLRGIMREGPARQEFMTLAKGR